MYSEIFFIKNETKLLLHFVFLRALWTQIKNPKYTFFNTIFSPEKGELVAGSGHVKNFFAEGLGLLVWVTR